MIDGGSGVEGAGPVPYPSLFDPASLPRAAPGPAISQIAAWATGTGYSRANYRDIEVEQPAPHRTPELGAHRHVL